MTVDVHAWGVWFLVCVHITTPINILTDIAIYRTPSYRKRDALRIMLSLSVAELGQLLNSVLACALWLGDVRLGGGPLLGLSVVNNGLWCVTLFSHVLLVVERLQAVWRVTEVQLEERKRAVGYAIAAVWLAGFVQTAIWHYCGAMVIFDRVQMRWNPRTDLTEDPRVNSAFAVFNCALCGLGAAGTVAIFAKIYYERFTGHIKTLPRRFEYRILVQNTVIFACALLSMFSTVLIPFVNETVRTNVLNVVLICASPYLYLALNRDIRLSFLRLFGRRSPGTNSWLSAAKTTVPVSSTVSPPNLY